MRRLRIPPPVRGEAYLRGGKGQLAATEFQKLIDHRGVVVNFVLGALVHLQLGRAYVLAGEHAKARKPTKTSSPSGKVPIPTSPS